MNNLKEHARLFTFGCSCTQYKWPTWADILGKEVHEFQNWGLNGGGNDLILNRLMECHQRNTINKKDLIVIMWTGAAREDHFYNGHWQCPGNVYTIQNSWGEWVRKVVGSKDSKPYSAEWLAANRSGEGYLLKTLNYITAAKTILDSIGCEYYFLSMIDFGYDVTTAKLHRSQAGIKRKRTGDTSSTNQSDEPSFSPYSPEFSEMLELYRDILESIKPSIHREIFNYNWLNGDYDNVKVTTPGGLYQKDPHPTPARYRDYLKKIFPHLKLSKDTEEFVDHWEQRVLNLTKEDNEKCLDPIKYGQLYPLPNIKAF